MSEKLYKYLVMQVKLGKLTVEEVQAKYPDFVMPD